MSPEWMGFTTGIIVGAAFTVVLIAAMMGEGKE